MLTQSSARNLEQPANLPSAQQIPPRTSNGKGNK